MFFQRTVTLLIIFFFLFGYFPASSLAQDISSTPEITALVNNENQLTIASLNVKNLDARDASTRFNAFGELIATNLQSPDIIALSEIQDNDGPQNTSVTAANRTYQSLTEAIKRSGGPAYRSVDIAPIDDTNGGEPGGNIRNGFLFNPARVNLASGTAGSATTAVQVSDTPSLLVNPGLIEPENPAFEKSRKPLAAEFLFNQEPVFVVANHFASKRGGAAADRKRIRQAQSVHNFVQEILDEDSEANIVVAGDLNDFEQSPTLRTLAGTSLLNLVESIPKTDRFTFKFRGDLQVLDHILVSQNLSSDANAEIDIVHANVDQADPASDHDPVLARFTISPLSPIEFLEDVEIPETLTDIGSTIFPDLNNDELAARLQEEFKVTNSLGYRRARDLMYGQIDNQNGKVLGIYTNYTATIAPNIDTSREEARRAGINTEHSWPRSKGTRGGEANSDLHHLFPTRERVNSIRGSDPFGEIQDSDTERWFFEEQELSTIPSDNIIDQFSESNSEQFEPRENVKGDLARAQFYVFTIYKDQVDAGFFSRAKEALCKWDIQDPVDEQEMSRNKKIKAVQGNDNPFILDPNLANRLYCDS